MQNENVGTKRAEELMNTEFFYDGPIGLLYYGGPAWTFLVIVVFLGLVFIVVTRKNRP